jgi:hypothetical protein
MGFTHYWEHVGINSEDWRVIAIEAHRLFDTAEEESLLLCREFNEPNTRPEVNESYIQFNGAGEQGHETFRFSREATEFDFCKTARKPYDDVVEEILKFASDRVPRFIYRNDDIKGNYRGENTVYY